MQAEQTLVETGHRADTEAQLRARAEDDARQVHAEIGQLRIDLEDAHRRGGGGAGLDIDQLRELITTAVRGSV